MIIHAIINCSRLIFFIKSTFLIQMIDVTHWNRPNVLKTSVIMVKGHMMFNVENAINMTKLLLLVTIYWITLNVISMKMIVSLNLACVISWAPRSLHFVRTRRLESIIHMTSSRLSRRIKHCMIRRVRMHNLELYFRLLSCCHDGLTCPVPHSRCKMQYKFINLSKRERYSAMLTIEGCSAMIVSSGDMFGVAVSPVIVEY